MSDPSHAARLDRLAEVAVRVGLGLAPGQELVLTAPLGAVPLVRRVTEHAYRAGASLVTTLYADDECTLSRFKHAPDAAFDYAPAWMFEGMAAAFRNGAARMAIGGDNPALLAGQDPDRVSRANRARSVAYRPALELITGFATNWSIVCYATPAWAALMFPDLPEGGSGRQAVGRDLRRVPRGRTRSGGRLGRPQRRAACPHHLPQRQAVRGIALPRPRH